MPSISIPFSLWEEATGSGQTVVLGAKPTLHQAVPLLQFVPRWKGVAGLGWGAGNHIPQGVEAAGASRFPEGFRTWNVIS